MSASNDGRELGPPLETHRFDAAKLGDYLATHIPEFEPACTIRQFLGGQSNPTFLIESGSRNYVVRKKPPGKLLPSAHAVDREYRVIAALAGSDVPVPAARLLCDDDSVVGQMFYVMDYVPGRVIADPTLPGCSADDRTAMYHDAADVLGRLHGVDYQRVGLSDFGKPTDYVARQVSRWSRQYEASATDTCPEMERLIDWLPANNPRDEAAAIVHGDYRPGNLIFAASRPDVVAVLDWELATIGHPLADVGYFLMPYWIDARASPTGLGGIDLDALGIPGHEELLRRYARSAGRADVPEIDFYVVFSMFRLAAILAGVLRRGLDGNAADPRAVEQGQAFRQLAKIACNIIEA